MNTINEQNNRAYRYMYAASRLAWKLNELTLGLVQEGWRVQAINARTAKMRETLATVQSRAIKHNYQTGMMIRESERLRSAMEANEAWLRSEQAEAESNKMF